MNEDLLRSCRQSNHSLSSISPTRVISRWSSTSLICSLLSHSSSWPFWPPKQHKQTKRFWYRTQQIHLTPFSGKRRRRLLTWAVLSRMNIRSSSTVSQIYLPLDVDANEFTRAFAATAPAKALDFISTLGGQYLPTIEEDQIVSVNKWWTHLKAGGMIVCVAARHLKMEVLYELTERRVCTEYE